MLAGLRQSLEEAEGRGIPPDEVAKAVAHALTAKRPKTRYLVGRDARIQAVAGTVMPDRVLDRLIAGQMHLPKTAAPGAASQEREKEPAAR
jgi:hypothetical protein